MIGSWEIRRADDGIEPIRLEAVDDEGRVIGTGWARPDFASDDTIYRAHIEVDPAFRRQGAGTLLLAQLKREVVVRGATTLRMRFDATDLGAMAFARQHGFAELHRMVRSVLRVSDIDPLRALVTLEQARSQGIVISTLAHDLTADEHCVERLHDLVARVVDDIPDGSPPSELTLPEFRELHVDDPDIIPEAYFLARVGERYVGLSYLRAVDDSDTVQQALSGVRREYRNRGIARTLKLQAIDYALRAGYEYVLANNHSTNPSMLELNRSLGFVPQSEEVRLERPL